MSLRVCVCAYVCGCVYTSLNLGEHSNLTWWFNFTVYLPPPPLSPSPDHSLPSCHPADGPPNHDPTPRHGPATVARTAGQHLNATRM